jgi:hypothetical protein
MLVRVYLVRLKLPPGIPDQCEESNRCPECGDDCIEYKGHKPKLKHMCIKWHKWE